MVDTLVGQREPIDKHRKRRESAGVWKLSKQKECKGTCFTY